MKKIKMDWGTTISILIILLTGINILIQKRKDEDRDKSAQMVLDNQGVQNKDLKFIKGEGSFPTIDVVFEKNAILFIAKNLGETPIYDFKFNIDRVKPQSLIFKPNFNSKEYFLNKESMITLNRNDNAVLYRVEMLENISSSYYSFKFSWRDGFYSGILTGDLENDEKFIVKCCIENFDSNLNLYNIKKNFIINNSQKLIVDDCN